VNGAVTGCYKNDVQDYWNGDETQDTLLFRQNMSRDRFLIILSIFHLADNDLQVPRGQKGFDALHLSTC
jgi:hypothetical protein